MRRIPAIAFAFIVVALLMAGISLAMPSKDLVNLVSCTSGPPYVVKEGDNPWKLLGPKWEKLLTDNPDINWAKRRTDESPGKVRIHLKVGEPLCGIPLSPAYGEATQDRPNPEPQKVAMTAALGEDDLPWWQKLLALILVLFFLGYMMRALGLVGSRKEKVPQEGPHFEKIRGGIAKWQAKEPERIAKYAADQVGLPYHEVSAVLYGRFDGPWKFKSRSGEWQTFYCDASDKWFGYAVLWRNTKVYLVDNGTVVEPSSTGGPGFRTQETIKLRQQPPFGIAEAKIVQELRAKGVSYVDALTGVLGARNSFHQEMRNRRAKLNEIHSAAWELVSGQSQCLDLEERRNGWWILHWVRKERERLRALEQALEVDSEPASLVFVSLYYDRHRDH